MHQNSSSSAASASFAWRGCCLGPFLPRFPQKFLLPFWDPASLFTNRFAISVQEASAKHGAPARGGGRKYRPIIRAATGSRCQLNAIHLHLRSLPAQNGDSFYVHLNERWRKRQCEAHDWSNLAYSESVRKVSIVFVFAHSVNATKKYYSPFLKIIMLLNAEQVVVDRLLRHQL